MGLRSVLFYLALSIIVLLAPVLYYNASQFGSHLNLASSSQILPLASIRYIPSDNPIQRLSKALQYKTISFTSEFTLNESNPSLPEFKKYFSFLEQSFPLLHSTLKREFVNTYSLLFEWKGRNPTLKPILLMSHLDVVPIEDGTEHEWEHPPFSGDIADGFVWGRGTLDVKTGVCSILESIEYLLQNKFVPERSIFLAFGHDEEVGGVYGAKRIAEIMKERGIRFELVIDEGGSITQDVIDIKKPIALIGLAEKGYVSLKLQVDMQGGHSSMPPKESAIGVISNAISNIEANPMPASVSRSFVNTLEYLANDMPPYIKLLAGNLWLFEPLMIKVLEAKPSTNAVIRTTIVPTVISAGTKDNVLAKRAIAMLNSRILPGDTIETVKQHVQRVVNDPRVKITEDSDMVKQASPISRTDSIGWKLITSTIQTISPDAIIAPYIVMGATDARYFYSVSDSVYRYLPYTLRSEDLARIHGTNERVAIKDYHTIISFWTQLLQNAQVDPAKIFPEQPKKIHEDL